MSVLRWLVCCMVSVAMALPPTAAVAAPDAFGDDDGTPYEAAIDALATAGIVEGCDDGGFCPWRDVQRDQAASMLSRAFELPEADRDHFDDDDGSVHEDAINRLAAAEVSVGCDDGRYCVDRPLDRAQMATLLARAAHLPTTQRTFFRDVWGLHGDAVNRLAAAGVTDGCTAKAARFCPRQDVRRGELATFVARALDRVPRTSLDPLSKAELRPKPRPTRGSKPATPKPTPRRQRTAAPADGVWDRLARCESGGNWSINTGNGYYGGLQFSVGSWRAVGGRGYPHQASRAEQIKRGRMLKARQGWGAWPSCTSRLGLR